MILLSINKISHCKSLSQIQCWSLFFLVILFLSCRYISNWFLNPLLRIFDIINLSLNIAEGPLLTLLHLNHHFLNLFKLLETIWLHFFKLLLFRNKHIKPNFFISKESMLDHFIVLIFLKLDSCFCIFIPSLIKRVRTELFWSLLLVLQNHRSYILFFIIWFLH